MLQLSDELQPWYSLFTDYKGEGFGGLVVCMTNFLQFIH